MINGKSPVLELLGFLGFGLESLPFLGVLKPEFDKTGNQLFLSNASGLVTIVLNHGHAATLDLAGTKCGKNDEAILAVDVFRNKNQAVPPKDEMISSIRTCCRDGSACPERTMDSSS